MDFRQKLIISAEDAGSLVSFGLDPVVETFPEKYGKLGIEAFPDYLKEIFDEMAFQGVLASAFKANEGFYERYDDRDCGNLRGTKTLMDVIHLVKDYFPDSVFIFDTKRGDIGKSSLNYASEQFSIPAVDAVTVHPMMGFDSVFPFLLSGAEAGDKGVYLLTLTSNPGAADFEKLKLADGRSFYEAVADKIIEWGKHGVDSKISEKWKRPFPGLGSVIGATNEAELEGLAKRFVDAGYLPPTLLPGINGQGGNPVTVMETYHNLGYGKTELALLRLNSSSGLTQPWAKDKQHAPVNYVDVVVGELEELNKNIAYHKVI